MEPKVSVVIPVYNAAQFLDISLQSVINQTLKETEIICINDGSSDNSLDILMKYKKIDDRVIVFNQCNHGAGHARNVGLKIARGKYIIFLDADDYFELDYFYLAYNQLESTCSDICIVRSDSFDNETLIHKSEPRTFRREWLDDASREIFNRRNIVNGGVFNFCIGWTWDKMFSREFIKNTGIIFQEQRTTNDAAFVFLHMTLAERICYVDKILAHQRVNISHSLSATRELSWQCFYKAIYYIGSVLQERNIFHDIRDSFLIWVLNFSIWNLRTISNEKKTEVYNVIKNKIIFDFELTYFFQYPKDKYCYCTKDLDDIKMIFDMEYDEYARCHGFN